MVISASPTSTHEAYQRQYRQSVTVMIDTTTAPPLPPPQEKKKKKKKPKQNKGKNDKK